MEPRFRSLRIIGGILKALAWLVLAVGVIVGLVLLVGAVTGTSFFGGYGASLGPAGGLFAGLLGGLSALAGAFLGFLVLYAYGDAIFLALAIEENTRETAYYLKGGDSLGPQL